MRLLFSLLLVGFLSSCSNPIAEREKNKRKRNAQNLASVFSSAKAAGADFSKVRNKFDAIELLRKGVYGANRFSTYLFEIPGMTDKDAKRAANYITFDSRERFISYSTEKVP